MVAAAPIARRRPGAATARRPAVDPRIGSDRVPTMQAVRRDASVAAEADTMPGEAPIADVSPVAATVLPPAVGIGEGTAPALADRAAPRWIAALTAAALLHGLAVRAFVPSDAEDTAAAAAAAVQTIDFVALDAADTVDASAGAAPSPPVETEEPPKKEPPTETTASTTPPDEAPEPPPPQAVRPPDPVRLPEAAPPRPADVAPAKPKPTRPAESRRKPVAHVARTQPVRRAAATPGTVADRRSGGAPSVGAAEAAVARDGELRSWRAAVLAALAAAKTYPEEARAQGRGGRAAVRFTIRRDGGVDGIALATSSGVASLDAATLAMPRRARFPAMPAAAGSSQSFTAGVRYDLR